MAAMWSQIREIPASVLALSPMDKAHTAKAKEELKHPFAMLSDQGNVVAGKLNLPFAFPESMKEAYMSFGTNLAEYNGGEAPWVLPMPAVFVIAPGGRITWRYVNSDYTKRPEPETVLEELRKAAV